MLTYQRLVVSNYQSWRFAQSIQMSRYFVPSKDQWPESLESSLRYLLTHLPIFCEQMQQT